MWPKETLWTNHRRLFKSDSGDFYPLAMFCFQTPPLSSELPQEKGDSTPPGMVFEGKQ